MTDTIVLTQCVSTKTDDDGKIPARERYDSRLWEAQERYAEALADDWYILSAKHGLIEPSTPIRDYDKSIGDLTADERREWATEAVDALDEKLDLDSVDRVVATAGTRYMQPVTAEIESRSHDIDVQEPLTGKRLNARTELMKELAWNHE